MSLAGLCNATMTVQRPTYTADSYGGHTASFAAVYTDIRCSFQPASGRVIERFAKRGIDVSHTAYTPTAVTILAGDRVVFNSENYVAQWGEDQAGRNRVYAVHVKKQD